jgi:hypothetical protein
MFEVNKRELEAVFPSTPLDAVIRKPFVPSQMIEEMRRFLPPNDSTENETYESA